MTEPLVIGRELGDLTLLTLCDRFST